MNKKKFIRKLFYFITFFNIIFYYIFLKSRLFEFVSDFGVTGQTVPGLVHYIFVGYLLISSIIIGIYIIVIGSIVETCYYYIFKEELFDD